MNTRQLVTQFSIAQYRLRGMIQRYRLAIAYARNRIDPVQANEIIYDCQAAAGWFPLESFSIDRCLQTALELREGGANVVDGRIDERDQVFIVGKFANCLPQVLAFTPRDCPYNSKF